MDNVDDFLKSQNWSKDSQNLDLKSSKSKVLKIGVKMSKKG